MISGPRGDTNLYRQYVPTLIGLQQLVDAIIDLREVRPQTPAPGTAEALLMLSTYRKYGLGIAQGVPRATIDLIVNKAIQAELDRRYPLRPEDDGEDNPLVTSSADEDLGELLKESDLRGWNDMVAEAAQPLFFGGSLEWMMIRRSVAADPVVPLRNELRTIQAYPGENPVKIIENFRTKGTKGAPRTSVYNPASGTKESWFTSWCSRSGHRSNRILTSIFCALYAENWRGRDVPPKR